MRLIPLRAKGRALSQLVDGHTDLGKVRADKLDVEFSLGSLMRGEWRATELTVNGLSLDLGLDPKGRIDWPVAQGTFGSPSFYVGTEPFFGKDRLRDVEEEILAQKVR